MTDVQTTCAKIVITTGRDCGSASWIKITIDARTALVYERLGNGMLIYDYCKKYHK